jgi:hypothetical protein
VPATLDTWPGIRTAPPSAKERSEQFQGKRDEVSRVGTKSVVSQFELSAVNQHDRALWQRGVEIGRALRHEKSN